MERCSFLSCFVNSRDTGARTFTRIWMGVRAKVPPLFTILMFPKWRLHLVN